MSNGKKFFNPKTGENHGIFGYHYLKFHRMRDPKWTQGDKIIQYSGISKLYERDGELKRLETILKRKNKQLYTKKIHIAIKDNTSTLHVATVGDSQRVKNCFLDHLRIQRAYNALMIERILEKLDQEKCVKRKILNLHTHRLCTLAKYYEGELMKLSTLQDRTKFSDPQELYEEIEAKHYELELRNYSTRSRTASAVTRAYNIAITVMLKDSIYYDSVLSSLQEDLVEQDRFIQKTIRTGIPAMKNIQSLQQEFENLNTKTSQRLSNHFNELIKQQEILNTNNTTVKTLVRRDSDFEVNPLRYNRDTQSMTDLKIERDAIEIQLKKLKNTTSCGHPKQIYPRVKQQRRDNKLIKKRLTRREFDSKKEQIETELAQINHDELLHDYTPDELRRKIECKSVEDDIVREKKKQDEILAQDEELEEVNRTLKTSFEHILDIMKNMETESNAGTVQRALNTARFDTSIAPTKVDCAVLIPNAKERINYLMKLNSAAVDQSCLYSKEYQTDILEERNEYQLRNMKETRRSIMDSITIEDPNIFTRKQIKLMSEAIVKKNMKQDD
ncbi:uncharacterized protein LOC129762889 [Toxorhynchites rutilus septentrionalis]|uniref:uncharacterized protein LOC129762889 n=1 Tax=Toxorhynchites rutilus septentrionalis TaxID=329112 RepID=UPI00247ABC17|nr:uncharacterized protein LOC129762889 [Toxorhynchites rutilus septentrionalis]